MKMTFETSVHKAVWGTENWVVSAHASDPSIILDGHLAGRTLHDVCPQFPLLFKVIDAKSRLSVQVHPNESTCLETGGEPKSEMWCALSDGPIYAGLRPGTTSAEIRAAVEGSASQGSRFEDLLVRHELRFGDVLFIPGGLVHAIGDGVKLYEVQQSSDTTFRLYDWGRVGLDGKPRELHVDKGLAAIDCSLPVPASVKSLKTPYFDFSQCVVRGEVRLATGSAEFLVVYVARGALAVDGVARAEGFSALLSPCSSCVLSAAEDAHVFVTRFGGEGFRV